MVRETRELMARTKGKTEHAGAKNGGGGMWGRRAEVKDDSNKRRRAADTRIIAADLVEDEEAFLADFAEVRDALGDDY